MRRDKEICSQGKSANFLKQMPMLLAPSCSRLKTESKFIIKELARHADCTHISLKGKAYKVKKTSQYHSLLKHRSNNPPSFLPAQTALSTPVYTQLHFFLLYYLCILYTQQTIRYARSKYNKSAHNSMGIVTPKLLPPNIPSTETELEHGTIKRPNIAALLQTNYFFHGFILSGRMPKAWVHDFLQAKHFLTCILQATTRIAQCNYNTTTPG